MQFFNFLIMQHLRASASLRFGITKLKNISAFSDTPHLPENENITAERVFQQ